MGITDEALGRIRGVLSIKLHLARDRKGRQLSVVVIPGQRHESTQLTPVLDAIRVQRLGRAGRPRKRPQHVIADRGTAFRVAGGCCGDEASRIRSLSGDQRERRAKCPGRPLSLDAATFARRIVVERYVNRLKQWRGVATRYEKSN